jgi:hypothetical protein
MITDKRQILNVTHKKARAETLAFFLKTVISYGATKL